MRIDMRAHLPVLALFVLPSLGTSAQTPTPLAGAQAARVRHTLNVSLDPKTHRIAVDASIALPSSSAPVELLLNAALRVTNSEPGLSEIPLGDTRRFFGINASEAPAGGAKLKRYRIARPSPVLRLNYELSLIHI